MKNPFEKSPKPLVNEACTKAARQACVKDFIRNVIIPEYERGGYDVEIDFPALHQKYQENNPRLIGIDFSLEDVVDMLREYVAYKGDYGDLNPAILVRAFCKI